MLLCIFIISCATVALSDNSVRFAAIIYRHGDRTPVDTYPTDPYRNQSLWPVKWGELTNVGKMQHYVLGKWLRQRYSHLLSNDFDPTEIYVRSTDVDRTLMSAQSNLAGMYPPVGKSIWDNLLMWQPIPVHTEPELMDELLAMKRPCPAYDKEYQKFINSKEYIERLTKYKKLMHYLSANTGLKVKDYDDIGYIYSTLYIETLYNFTLPNWTQSVYPDKLKEPSGYSFATPTATKLMARLKSGPLLKQITSHMINAILNEHVKHYKVMIYSGHDFTIGNILNSLGLYDGICPVYTSTILFELIYDNSTSSHYVRISYRNSTQIVEPYVLSIPDCGEACPVDKFMKIYDDLLKVDWEYECGEQFQVFLDASFVAGLGLFMVIYVLHKVYFTRVYKQIQNKMAYTSVHNQVVTTIKVIDD